MNRIINNHGTVNKPLNDSYQKKPITRNDRNDWIIETANITTSQAPADRLNWIILYSFGYGYHNSWMSRIEWWKTAGLPTSLETCKQSYVCTHQNDVISTTRFMLHISIVGQQGSSYTYQEHMAQSNLFYLTYVAHKYEGAPPHVRAQKL